MKCDCCVWNDDNDRPKAEHKLDCGHWFCDTCKEECLPCMPCDDMEMEDD